MMKILVGAIGFLFITIISVIVIVKNKLLENKYFYISIFTLLALLLFVYLVFLFFQWLGPKPENKDEYDLNHYFEEINKKCKELYGTSDIDWGGGQEVRYHIKHYGNEEYVGLVGERSENLSTIVVVAKLLERGKIKIYRFVGNTFSSKLINDPFHKFHPKHQDNYNLFSSIYKDERNTRRRRTMPIVINQGGDNNESVGNAEQEQQNMA